jgi:S1-C subfamily serine protease
MWNIGKIGTTFVVLMGVGAGAAIGGAPKPDVATNMPEPGQSNGGADSHPAFPGIPLPEGMTLDALQDLLKTMTDTDRSAMRGAKEVAIFRKAAPAVVFIQTSQAFGSGFLLKSGLIVTNRHVVEGIGRVQIFFKPDDAEDKVTAATSGGTVRWVDPQRDLAMIEPDNRPVDFKYLNISQANEFDIGDDVYAIGHPLGYKWTFTQGIISGIQHIDNGLGHYMAIQTQTPINPGNSGGPLLNVALEVVGINTLVRNEVEEKELAGEKVTIAHPAQGLNFAVSAPELRQFVNNVASGKVTTLPLELPAQTSGCSGQITFNGRTKANDGGLQLFSLRCDGKVDAWELFPDDRSKPVEYHVDPDRRGADSIIVYSDPASSKWDHSFWDIFRDGTFAVKGYHDDGTVKPTRFEYARS